jgi:hypothetical protein
MRRDRVADDIRPERTREDDFPQRGAGDADADRGAAGSVTGRVTRVLHHVHASGSVSILFRDAYPLVSAMGQSRRGELPVMVELTDQAPVDLREPIRGLLWTPVGYARSTPSPHGQARSRSPRSGRTRGCSTSATR